MWSEGISGSENDDGTIDQQIDEKHENSSQDKPSAFQQTSATTVQHSSLRNRENGRSDEATPANEYFSQLELSTTSILQIKIGRLRLLEHSILLEPKYDGARVFVEWALLDLNREICETPGTIILPRSKNAYQGFDYERGAVSIIYCLHKFCSAF
jgi:hypothetical protein